MNIDCGLFSQFKAHYNSAYNISYGFSTLRGRSELLDENKTIWYNVLSILIRYLR